MKWEIKRSDEVKAKIASNKELMSALSKTMDKTLKKHGLKLDGVSYVFEPRVFTMTTKDVPDLMIRSRAEMLAASSRGMVSRADTRVSSLIEGMELMSCLPQCGPMDPLTLRVLERIRLSDMVADDPVPIRTSEALMKSIMKDSKLLKTLSGSIFKVLDKHKIKFKKNEGCVFTPCVFETPVYAQKVGVAKNISQVPGFGPQVLGDPTPEPAVTAELRVRPFPGIIEIDRWRTPGIIVHKWWWIGIPAPEMLHALDKLRNM